MEVRQRGARLARVALVVPLLVGVFAMHVLLLCVDLGHDAHGADGRAPMGPHAVAGAVHAAEHQVEAVLSGAAHVADRAAASVSAHGDFVCVGVLVAMGLVLRRSRTVLCRDDPVGRDVPGPPRGVPPPPPSSRLLTLCVLRT